MLHRKTRRSIWAALLAAVLLLLAACGGGKGGNDKTGESPATAGASPSASAEASGGQTPPPEPITISVLFNSTDDTFEKTAVFEEIVKRTGITMDIEKYDEEKFKVLLAGGDLPDVIQVPGKYLPDLIDGNNIIPLDELVETNGPALKTEEYADSIAYSRQFMSNGTGKLYQIPIQIGKGDFAMRQDVGFVTRWDYYKEIGYPKISNIDDMVQVIADIIAKHPQTADGKKVYGVSLFNDWGHWGISSIGLVTGQNPFGKARSASWDSIEGKFYNQYTDPEHSAVWDTAYFLYKANQAGVLDPDAFIDKYNDVVAKVTQGTLVYIPATWPSDVVNAELLKEGPDKGYMTIPLDWGYAYAGGDRLGGWGDKAFAITKNAKNPQRAMDLINFIASEEGSRLLASGIQGVHWDLVDGKPQMKPETIQLESEGGDPWKLTGIGGMDNQRGLADYVVAGDGGNINLRTAPEVFQTKLNSLDKDYSSYYGVSHPSAAYKKYVEEGKVKTINDNPNDIIGSIPNLPEELIRKSEKVDDLILKGIPQVVLKSKNDAEFEANRQKLIDEVKAAGTDEVFQWVLEQYEKQAALFAQMTK